MRSNGKKTPTQVVEIDGALLQPAGFNQILSTIRYRASVYISNVTPQQFKKIEQQLNTIKDLQYLEITGMAFTQNFFANCNFTTDTLVFNDCRLAEKPKHQVPLPAYSHLGFTWCTDTLVNAMACQNKTLQSLAIEHCSMENTQPLFDQLQQYGIRYLQITNCGLEKFPFMIESAPLLESLDISHNNISLLDTTGINRLTVFKCEGNPIDKTIRQVIPKIKSSDRFAFRNQENDRYFQSEHRFLKPASQNYNVATQVTTISTDKPSTIKAKSEALFDIPADCFVDQNGNPVKGQVDVVVREYNDPASIVLSGIPMFVKKDSISDYLVSDGMFEIQAYANNEKLQLQAGKEIKVKYPTINNRTGNNNLYDLNDSTGNWNNISAQSNFTSSLTPVTPNRAKLTPAVERYNELKKWEHQVKDTSSFDFRFNDKWHCGETIIDSGLITRKHTYEDVFKNEKENENYILVGRTTGTGANEKTLIRLVNRNKKTSHYATMRSVWWEVTSPLSDEEKEKLMSNGSYCDVRFAMENDTAISLSVKDYSGIQKYELEPFSHRKNKYVRKKSVKLVKQMVACQDKHNLRFKATINQSPTTSYSLMSRRKKWRKIKPLRNATEASMSRKEFERYAESTVYNFNLGNIRNAYNFSIKGLGVKNIDCKKTLSNPIDLIATTASNDTLINAYVYQPSKGLLINFNCLGNNFSHVFAEQNADTYILNVSNEKIGFTKIEKRDMKNLPDNETVCTHATVSPTEFDPDKMDKALEKYKPLVYPNPGSDHMTITFNGYTQFEVSLYNAAGKEVAFIPSYQSGSSADISHLANGTYLVHLRNKGVLLGTTKLIKTN